MTISVILVILVLAFAWYWALTQYHPPSTRRNGRVKKWGEYIGERSFGSSPPLLCFFPHGEGIRGEGILP